MPGIIAKSAWDRGALNGLLTSAIFIALWLTMVGLFVSVRGVPFAEALIPAFALFWILVVGRFLFTWARDRKTGGNVLLDCGPHPGRILLRVLALIFLFVSLDFGRDLGYRVILFGAITAIYFMTVSFGRLQFRENGIFRYWDFLPWSRIMEYTWSEDSNLLITSRGKLGFVDFGALPVPPESKAEIERILLEKQGASSAHYSS